MLSHQLLPLAISVTMLPCPGIITNAPEQGQPLRTTC
jgi:hypothetical protein